MRPFRIQPIRVTEPPDGMLFWVDIQSGLVTAQFHERFFSEGIRHDFDEWNRHATRCELYVQEDDGTPVFTGGTHRLEGTTLSEEGTYGAHMDAVSEEVLPLATMAFIMSDPHGLLYLVRKDVVKPELVRDFNEIVSSVPMKSKLYRRI